MRRSDALSAITSRDTDWFQAMLMAWWLGHLSFGCCSMLRQEEARALGCMLRLCIVI